MFACEAFFPTDEGALSKIRWTRAWWLSRTEPHEKTYGDCGIGHLCCPCMVESLSTLPAGLVWVSRKLIHGYPELQHRGASLG